MPRRPTLPPAPETPLGRLADGTPLLTAPTAATVESPAGAPEFVLPEDMVLNERVFARYMRLVDVVYRRTGLKIHVDQRDQALEDGDIYLFNHFTRFETVIAPYIIHRETGKLVRSVAYHGLFDVHDTLTRIIRQSGAVPTNMPRLLPFLAEEILRGRKVIIFPEGGLVKNKHVLDANGDLKMWSGISDKVRKPHRGAAALALMLDLAKRRIRALFEANDRVQLANWCDRLNLSLEELQAAVARPTRIVPGNITFYPMRTNPNLLLRGVERFAGTPAARARDELTIEGNLLLRPTDMDIRFGSPIAALKSVRRLHLAMLDHVLATTQSMDDIFALKDEKHNLLNGYMASFLSRRIDSIRDDYARRMYLGTTININHLVATLVQALTARNVWSMAKAEFHTALFVMVKELQQRTDVNLHVSLSRPDIYAGLRQGTMRGYVGFLEACTRAKLMNVTKDTYTFSRRLLDTMDMQDVRLENPLLVHANEAQPITAVREVAELVLPRLPKLTDIQLAELRFDDMLREHAALRLKFGKLAPHMLLAADNPLHGSPYLLRPEGKPRRTGVVLVHGFATTPAELRPYAEHLRNQGYTVLGVRLPGHGTSILDLEERHRHEWLAQVREAYESMTALTDDVALVGFSTGAAVALQLAAENPAKLVQVISIAAPYKVRDSNMHYLPFGMALRAVLSRLPLGANLLRFYTYDKDISGKVYHRVPLAALNQLRLTIADMWASLPQVRVPVLVLQGLLDRTVVPKSALHIYRRLGSSAKTLRWVPGGAHALMNEDTRLAWSIVDEALNLPLTGKLAPAPHKPEHPIAPCPAPAARGRKRTAWLLTRKATG